MTREELRDLSYGTVLHYAPACKYTRGPKGGIGRYQERWRISGVMREWKTRPTEFHRPVKYGLRSYGRVDQNNVQAFVTESACPVCNGLPTPKEV